MGSYVLAVVDDLILYSKIKAIAQKLGIGVERRTVREFSEEENWIVKPLAVIVDLTHYGERALTAAGQNMAGAFFVGVVGHLETEFIRKAYNAGCNEILVRSMLSIKLPQMLNDLQRKSLGP